MSDLGAASLEGYTVVRYVEDAEQAEEYRALLESHDIPTVIQGKDVSGDAHTFAVLVPEESGDDAEELVAMQATYDEYYDFPLDEDEDEGDDDYDTLYDDPY